MSPAKTNAETTETDVKIKPKKKTTTSRKKAVKKKVAKKIVRKKVVKKVAKKVTKKPARKNTSKGGTASTRQTRRKRDDQAVDAGFVRRQNRHPAVRKLLHPRSRSGLVKLCRDLLGVQIPSQRFCPHHHSPLDYLEASFLQQKDLLVWANRGGGKTMLAAALTVLDAIFRAPTKIRVLGGSMEQSSRLGEYIHEFLYKRPELLDGPIRKDRVNIVGGSEIRMLPQSQRAVRGQHVQKIRCDEVDLFDHDVWQAVQFATRSDEQSRGSIEVLSTLHRSGGLMHDLVQKVQQSPTLDTPAGGYHLLNWCLWEVIEKCPPSRECSSCLLHEDCGGLAREADGFFRIDDAITIKARSSKAAWEAEMLCKGLQRENAVFGEFQAGLHVRPMEYEPSWPTFRAIDFGYSAPLVCLWVQHSPTGEVVVLDEYVRSRLPIGQHAAAILKQDPGLVAATFVDPAGKGREATSGLACTDILAEAGIPCTFKPSRIMDGVELMRSYLAPAAGAPRLFIHPRCKTLIDCFHNYHFPDPGKGDPEKPVKDGYDHAIDALRYFFINRLAACPTVQRGYY